MREVMKGMGRFIGVAIMTIAIAGCGGGGGGNDLPDKPKQTQDTLVGVKKVLVNGEINNKHFSVDLNLQKDEGMEISMRDFQLTADGCMVDSSTLKFTPSTLQMQSAAAGGNLHIEGDFTEACRPSDFVLTYQRTLTYEGKTKTGAHSITFQMPHIQLVNTQSPIKVTYPDQQVILSFQMIYDGLPVLTSRACGMDENNITRTKDCIMPEALPREFGRIYRILPSNYSPQTTRENESAEYPTGWVPENGSTTQEEDVYSDGYVHFKYDAPSQNEMPSSKKSYDLKFYYIDANGSRVAETTVHIEIDPQGSYPGYQLVNATTPLVVTQPNDNRYISVQLVHSGLPVLSVRPCNPTGDNGTGDTKVTTDCVIPEALPKEFGRIDLTVWPQQDKGDEDATDGVNDNGYIRFPYVGPDRDDMPEERAEHNLTIYYVDRYGQRIAQTKVKIIIDPQIKFGPVTSLSLAYNGTECIKVDNNPSESGVANVARMIFTVHAVDKYGNPARAGVTLIPSLINGAKVANRANGNGELRPGAHATFVDESVDFSEAGVTDEDRLVILPNASNYRQAYLGDWTIRDVAGSTLQLQEAYNGSKAVSPLSYVIGNERRYIEGYGVAVADISKPTNEKPGSTKSDQTPLDTISKPTDTKGNTDRFGVGAANYVTDENGWMTFEIRYDYILAGHTLTVAVDSHDTDKDGKVVRAGVAKVDSFRWPGGYTSSETSVLNDGEEHNATISLMINGCDKNPIEALSHRQIVPESMIVTCKNDNGDDVGACDQCTLADQKTPLVTDVNGQVAVPIQTEGNTTKAASCAVKWNESDSGMYLEY